MSEQPDSLRMRVRRIFERPGRGLGRAVGLTIQGLILVSIVTFCVETLPDLSERSREILGLIEVVCVLAFSAEYILRLWSSERPLAYAFSFFGVIDLLAILPFFLAGDVDLRVVRIVRGLRLIRILKLVRYSAAMDRLARAARKAREELVLYTFATLILMFLASVGIYYCEQDAQPEKFASIFDAMWWSVATLTTVGYGDIFPVTVGGKLFTFCVLLLGLGMVAVPSAILASALTAVRDEEKRKARAAQEAEVGDTPEDPARG